MNHQIEQLRTENQQLRALIEQAIAQEEVHERQTREWSVREAELNDRLSQGGNGNSDELEIKLFEREDTVRLLTEQIQQLEQHLQYAQTNASNGDHEELLAAVRERDDLIHSLTARVAELEKQIADVPPPAPTDEELARMADELEKERCQITLLRRALEDEKKQHVEDQSDFERQMREMEVSMSRERAEMARQRMELQRLQAEVHSDLDAMQRGDSTLKDKLAALQRRQTGTSTPKAGGSTAATNAPAETDKDAGFMKRFFGGQK
ncbi:MAG: hypothetical protein ACJ8C4_21350 [Gemmataceae bacterium]